MRIETSENRVSYGAYTTKTSDLDLMEMIINARKFLKRFASLFGA